MGSTWKTLAVLALGVLANRTFAQPSLTPEPGAGYICWADDESRHRSGFVGGGSLLYVQPYYSGNAAFTTRTGINGPSPQESTTDFAWNFKPGMAFWLGYSGECGLGVRGRFFSFDQASGTLTASLLPAQGGSTSIRPPATLLGLAGSQGNFGSPGIILGKGFGQDLLSFGSNLKVYAVDVEATWDLARCNWGLQFAAGGRYLHMSQDYLGQLTNTIPGASETQTLTFGHNFTGAGPTVAFQACYHFGCSGFGLFGNARGALLVGQTRQIANFTQAIVDPNQQVGGTATISPGSSSTRQTIMPFAELEVGLEYTRNFGRLQPFVRASAINQTYFDVGNASQTTGNLSLFGVQFTLGFAY